MLGLSYVNGLLRPVTRCSAQHTASCLRQRHSVIAARNYHLTARQPQAQRVFFATGRKPRSCSPRSSTMSAVMSTGPMRIRDMHSSAGASYSFLLFRIPGTNHSISVYRHLQSSPPTYGHRSPRSWNRVRRRCRSPKLSLPKLRQLF